MKKSSNQIVFNSFASNTTNLNNNNFISNTSSLNNLINNFNCKNCGCSNFSLQRKNKKDIWHIMCNECENAINFHSGIVGDNL